MSRFLDKALDFEERWEKPISIVLGIWFWGSCAVTARFITLPDIPHFPEDEVMLYASAAFNAVWWGFARPAMLKRKAEREAEAEAAGEA